MNSKIYSVSIADISRERRRSKPFEIQMKSGRYIFADSCLCLNKPEYHVPVHYDSLANADGDTDGLDEKLDFMADTEPDPLERIMEGITQQEHEELLSKLEEAIKELQPQQKALVHKVFFEGRTCTSIAKQEGVSKAAISNRLKKIYATLGKKLKK